MESNTRARKGAAGLPRGGGTLWTITWDMKASCIKVYTRWLTFLLRDRRLIYRRVVSPVVAHFQEGRHQSIT